jgi:hypothetical protein
MFLESRERPVRNVNNLTILQASIVHYGRGVDFNFYFLGNLEASTPYNPMGLHSLLQG